MTDAARIELPAAALDAGVDALHLARETEERLRGLGLVLVGDLLVGGYLAPTAWGALGSSAGRAASEVLHQLAGHCLAGDTRQQRSGPKSCLPGGGVPFDFRHRQRARRQL